RLKDGSHAGLLQSFDVLIRNNAAYQHDDVVHLVLLEQFHDARDDGIVGTRENGKADHVDVFLKRCVDHHFRGLPQAGVDNFHAGIAQSTGDYLGAAIVAVKPGFGDQNADLVFLGHRTHLTTEDTEEHREMEFPIADCQFPIEKASVGTEIFASQSAIGDWKSLHGFDVHALPEIPAGDGAVGFPGAGDFFHDGWVGELALAVVLLDGGLHAIVAGGKDVWTAQGEHQEHVRGPDADTFHLREVLD